MDSKVGEIRIRRLYHFPTSTFIYLGTSHTNLLVATWQCYQKGLGSLSNEFINQKKLFDRKVYLWEWSGHHLVSAR